jgi:hypothetical protein
MKRSFLILILLIAFNIANPTVPVYSQSARHNIEFVRVGKSRDLTGNELLKAKVIQFIRYQLLLQRISQRASLFNSGLVFNSS